MTLDPLSVVTEPFGDADVDTEMKRLEDRYRDVYLRDTEFSREALDDRVYLISGRRGTGKTALSRYFKFQEQVPDVFAIEIRQRDKYPEIVAAIAKDVSSRTAAVDEMVKVWEVVVWSVILQELPGDFDARPPVSIENVPDRTPSGLLMGILGFINRGLEQQPPEERQVHTLINKEHLDAAIQDVKARLAEKGVRVILTLDTLEKYDANDTFLMTAVAALIELASNFNLEHGPSVQVKVFLPGEIFGHIEEAVLAAPAKHIRSPLHLIWTPSELLRLIMWRFWKHLFIASASARLKPPKVAWKDARDVYKKMWRQYFDKTVLSDEGEENSLSYILRHTQMRPRQVIRLCNAIAAASKSDRFAPHYDAAAIAKGVFAEVGSLVSDLISSFSDSSPNVSNIVNVLAGVPAVVDEATLLKHADMSRTYWPEGRYSADAFRDLLAELGMIGRITERREGFILAEFSYTAADKIVIGRNEDSVIHPMFYRRLGIRAAGAPRVLPFAHHYAELERIIR